MEFFTMVTGKEYKSLYPGERNEFYDDEVRRAMLVMARIYQHLHVRYDRFSSKANIQAYLLLLLISCIIQLQNQITQECLFVISCVIWFQNRATHESLFFFFDFVCNSITESNYTRMPFVLISCVIWLQNRFTHECIFLISCVIPLHNRITHECLFFWFCV
jgi:hypothetical protein